MSVENCERILIAYFNTGVELKQQNYAYKLQILVSNITNSPEIKPSIHIRESIIPLLKSWLTITVPVFEFLFSTNIFLFFYFLFIYLQAYPECTLSVSILF